MAILKVARMGHPVLREKCAPIDPKTIRSPQIQGLIKDMFETMAEYGGVGLAAPQVHQPVQLVIAGGDADEEGRPQYLVLINPEITVVDEDDQLGMYEGCLSVPGLRGWVERPAAIKVKAFDDRGKKVEFDLDGFPAVVMQHECDHLDGVLYVDQMKDMTKLAFEQEADRYHAQDLEEGEDEEYEDE
ncbi:MAG: peptide deformylase [Candidatus Krumholzibacteriia bacterium]|jgi:peptide deformylase